MAQGQRGITMNKLPKVIVCKREIFYTEDFIKELVKDMTEDFDMTEEEQYKELIDQIYEYACEDLARSWNKITMIDMDTGKEIDYKELLKL